MVPACIAYDAFPSLCAFALGEEGRENTAVDGRGESPSQRSTNNI